MNKNLTGDLLKALCDMGHGDKVAIVDANFPAHTIGQQVITYPGIGATELLSIISDIFPLDHIVREPVLLMDLTEEDRNTMAEPEIWSDFLKIIHKAYGEDIKVGKLSREEFYKASKGAYLIIQSSEERLYGNIILVKGIL